MAWSKVTCTSSTRPVLINLTTFSGSLVLYRVAEKADPALVLGTESPPCLGAEANLGTLHASEVKLPVVHATLLFTPFVR